MAIFNKSLEVLLSWEGGYSFNPHDPGGETYCGISRRNHPDWIGWIEIDRIKDIRNGKPILWNETYISLVPAVNVFYLNIYWNKESYSLINNQDIADKIFQHHVNMGIRAIYFAQVTLMHKIEKADGDLGPITAKAINESTPETNIPRTSFLDQYIIILEQYYEDLIREHTHLKVFEHEWLL